MKFREFVIDALTRFFERISGYFIKIWSRSSAYIGNDDGYFADEENYEKQIQFQTADFIPAAASNNRFRIRLFTEDNDTNKKTSRVAMLRRASSKVVFAAPYIALNASNETTFGIVELDYTGCDFQEVAQIATNADIYSLFD